MYLFCSRCGMQIPDGCRFCAKCGAPVVRQTATGNTDSYCQNVRENDLKLAKSYRVKSCFFWGGSILFALFPFAIAAVSSFLMFLNREFNIYILIAFVVCLIYVIASAVLLVRSLKESSRIYEEITESKGEYETVDLNKYEYFDHTETLPYPCDYVYYACIDTVTNDFRRPSGAVPCKQIYFGWLFTASGSFRDKIIIYLTPTNNGTQIITRFFRLKRRFKQRDNTYMFGYNDRDRYAHGIVDRIRRKLQPPVRR